MGAPRLEKSGHGDLLAHLDVRVPTRLSDEQKRLIQELAALDPPDAHQADDDERGFFGRRKKRK
jgi:molecular chaperone DnaJ